MDDQKALGYILLLMMVMVCVGVVVVGYTTIKRTIDINKACHNAGLIVIEKQSECYEGYVACGERQMDNTVKLKCVYKGE